MEQPKRRLSAVWFADIVGYSELSTRDEPAAMRLVDALQALSREIIPLHEGRLVKFIGDATLAEFASTESAVRAAVALQGRYVEAAAGQGQHSRLRIGVHLGEVNATPDGDLYGDGINTAARLHQKAAPGQVIISEDVWRQLRQRPEFRFAALGAVELRGITSRVEIYDVLFGARAALAPLSAATGNTRPVRPRRRRMPWLAAAGVILAVVAAAVFTRRGDPAAIPVPASVKAPAVDPKVATPEPPAVTPERAPLTTAVPAAPEQSRPASRGTSAADGGPRTKPVPSPPAPALTDARETPRPSPPPSTAVTPAGLFPPRGIPPGTGRANEPPVIVEIRGLLERLAAALVSDSPGDAVAALGPGAVPMSGRGVQQMKGVFGEGLSVRVGRIEPPHIRNDAIDVRFFLLAKSASRAETPLAFTAVLVRVENVLRFSELRREWPGRGRGDDRTSPVLAQQELVPGITVR